MCKMCMNMNMYIWCVCAVVQECKERLLRVGFKELSERDTWKIDKGGRVGDHVL